jgi:hypothetical protein
MFLATNCISLVRCVEVTTMIYPARAVSEVTPSVIEPTAETSDQN